MSKQWKRKVYSDEDYQNKLLLLERSTIEKALIIHEGNVKKAHEKLCPQDRPYKYNHLLRVLKKHKINRKDFVLTQ